MTQRRSCNIAQQVNRAIKTIILRMIQDFTR
jgi:hypothetical protein